MLKKFEAGWHGAEEVTHGKRRALWRSRHGDLGDVPIAGADLCSLRGFAVATEHGDLCHSGNAGQGFATEPERTDVLQVVDLRYFAGGMTRQGQL